MPRDARAAGPDVAADTPSVSARSVAHSLKQPLAVAWGYLELALIDRHARLTPTTCQYLREIQSALETMDRVVDSLDC